MIEVALFEEDEATKTKYAKLAGESVKSYTLGLDRALELKLLGNKLYSESKLPEALKIYSEANVLDQNNTSILSNLAHVHFLLKQHDAGLEFALKCTQLDSSFSRVI